jgi:Domain of unknown function (DUF4440)
MNKALVPLLMLLALAAVPRPAAADLKSDLVSLEKTMWVAWGKKDTATYAKYLDDNYRAVGDNDPPVVGKEASLKSLNPGSCELHDVTFEDVSVQKLGEDAAVLRYIAVQDITCGGKKRPPRVASTSVWHRVNGQWLATDYHESTID